MRFTLAIVGFALIPALAGGCGGSAPAESATARSSHASSPPEPGMRVGIGRGGSSPGGTPRPAIGYMPAPDAGPSPESLHGKVEGTPVERGSSSRLAAALRTQLARRFVYRDWYPDVRAIEVKGRTAFVGTWHLNRSGDARDLSAICGAVLSSHRVRAAQVLVDGRPAVACP